MRVSLADATRAPEPPRHAANDATAHVDRTLSPESVLRALVDQGVPYAKAAASVGLTVAQAQKLVPRHEPGRPISEAEEQRRIVKHVTLSGGKAWSTSSVRKSKIAAGFPDLWIVIGGVGLWWEAKTVEATKAKESGRSPEQVDFARGCEMSRTFCGVGTHEDFVSACQRRGIWLTEWVPA